MLKSSILVGWSDLVVILAAIWFEVTIFKSLGLAVEDVAAAHLAYTRAVEQGRGTAIKL